MKSALCFCVIFFLAFGVAGCVATDVGPINQHVARAGEPSPEFIPDPGDDGSTVVGLAFSGGGTRAAAFAYGVLRELDDVVVDRVPERRTLAEDVRMISGASGGAVTAAYFGYKGQGFRDLRERFLIRNAEAGLRTSKVSPVNLARAWNGGVNDRSGFAAWLDRNLFDGATYRDLRRPDAPIVWINASDIYNGTPFDFTYDTFAALCSDLDQVKLSDAVAASAAVPIVFAPIVVSTAHGGCHYRRPEWLVRALADPEASIRLKAYARALDSYQNPNHLNYVKLLDGGLTDNIGVTGFTLERASARTPYGPLSAAEAVKLHTLIFIVSDAGREQQHDWAEAVHGPKLPDLMGALTNAAVTAAMRDEFDALKLAVSEWRSQLVRYRCALPADAVRRYRGTLAGWNCRDVDLVVEDVSFAGLPPEERAKLNQIPTRLRLPVDQVDLTIAAGREAIRTNAKLQRAIADIRRRAGVTRSVVTAQNAN